MTLLELSERKAKEALPSPSCPAPPSCGPCWADGVGVGRRFPLEDGVAPAGAETFISSMHLLCLVTQMLPGQPAGPPPLLASQASCSVALQTQPFPP